MYTEQIIWFIVWPVLIWFSYKMIRLAINKFEKAEEASQE